MCLKHIASSVTGAKHIKAGRNTQDAFMSQLDKDKLFVALADGHGSKLHFRSEIGSGLAVISAIEIFKHHADGILKAEDFEERKRLTKNLAMAQAAYWCKLCLDDIKDSPFKADELSALTDGERLKLKHNQLLAYGTTMIAIANRRKRLLGYAIGDGDLLMLSGDEVTNLIEKDPLIADETHSLATSNSVSCVKYFEADFEDASFLVSTDGYNKSFESDEDFYSVIKDLKNILDRDGAASLEASLEKWLEETSQGGSGDDITCCFMF